MLCVAYDLLLIKIRSYFKNTSYLFAHLLPLLINSLRPSDAYMRR